MPLSNKTILDSHCFVHELKTEMHDDLEYVKSLEKEIDELESEKADFSNIYDLLLEECVSKDVTCSYLHSLSDLNANTELQCLYLHKVKECECLALKLSKQTESVNNEVHNKLLKSFAKLEKHSISLELSLQHCKEQMKNNPVCKRNASNVFRKEREQYHEIQDLKAQMQDKNMVINELKKLILVTKGKSVETQFDKPSVVRQPNAQRIPKPSVLGKPTPFSNSPEMRSFQTNKSVNKTNASDGLFKPVTQQNLPQKRNQAVRNTNVLKPGMFRIASTTTQTRTPQLPHAYRNTNPHMSKSSGVIHTTSVSRPQLKCYQVKDKVVPNNSQVKFQKKEAEDHHRISSISKKTKSVTACNDSSNSRTSNKNAVCAECGTLPISASKPKRKANKSVATPHKKTVASDTTIQKSKSYYKELYENTNQEWKWWIAKRCTSSYTCTQKPLKTKKIWMPKIRKADESISISPTIDIVSRITNIVQLILFIVDSGCTKFIMSTAQSQSFLGWSNSVMRFGGLLSGKSTCFVMKSVRETMINFVCLVKESKQKEVHSDKSSSLVPRKLNLFQHGLVWSNARCKHKWEEFLNKTLHAYFKEEGIEHQTSTPRTPEQNGVVERRNRTLVEAARTMLSASKLPLSFWAEAVATACYTQNRSIIISTHGKTAYHIINDRKPSIKHLHIFGCICYITRDGENLDKMKEKGDPCVMVGYSTQSKGYRVYNKRTRLIVESIHIKFDEIKEMMSDHNSSDLVPQRQETSIENVSPGLVPQRQKASDYDNSGPVPPRQNVVPTAEKTDSSH
ncbi:retrovirus-related pol polyprotein from transposon TNT 1-94 [Tanacetum coccineum]